MIASALRSGLGPVVARVTARARVDGHVGFVPVRSRVSVRVRVRVGVGVAVSVGVRVLY